MKLNQENPHWTEERWDNEKINTNKCITEVEQFISENENLSKQEINISTMDDFNLALENKKKIDKLQQKKKYLIHLKEKIEKIDSIKLNLECEKLKNLSSKEIE